MNSDPTQEATPKKKENNRLHRWAFFLLIFVGRGRNRPHKVFRIFPPFRQSWTDADLHFQAPSRFYNLMPKFRIIGLRELRGWQAMHGRSRQVANEIAKSQTVSQLEIGRVTDHAPRPILLLSLLVLRESCVCAACTRKCWRILFSFFYFFFELRVIAVKTTRRKDHALSLSFSFILSEYIRGMYCTPISTYAYIREREENRDSLGFAVKKKN